MSVLLNNIEYKFICSFLVYLTCWIWFFPYLSLCICESLTFISDQSSFYWLSSSTGFWRILHSFYCWHPLMSPTSNSRCKYNQSRILTNCSHLKVLEWQDDYLVVIFQELFGTLGGIALILNCLVLLESRYTSGGQSASLVFVRSLLVGDVLIGLFGITKAIYIEFRKDRKIDCFLSESLLITASTASAFSLLWLTVDSCLKLTRPLDPHFRMHKKNVIALMVILWNGSFLVGFAPQMGWVLIDCTCLFFCYYKPMYLLFVGILWDLCILITICLLVYQHASRQCSSSSFSLNTQEGKKYTMLIILVRVHIIVWLISYLPLKIYVLLKYFYLDDNSGSTSYTILYFLLLPLLKAIVCAILHGYQAREMRRVISRHCYHLVWCCGYWTLRTNTTYSVSIVGDNQLSSSVHFPSQLTFSSMLSTDRLNLSVTDFTAVTPNVAIASGHSQTVDLDNKVTWGNGSSEMVTHL